MKYTFVGFITAAVIPLAITACTEDKDTSQQYAPMVQSLRGAKSVEDKAHADAARKAIQEFHATQGRYPADLTEVAAITGIPLQAEKYDYNPEAGTLTVK